MSKVASDRNWSNFPAVVRLPASVGGKRARTLYALSDIHGHFDNFFEILLAAKVITKKNKGDHKPSNFNWIAGNAVLVHAGDLINKGKQSVETIKFAQNLEVAAAAAGGRAVFLAGNHEIRFLGNPFDEKFDEFSVELGEENLDRLCGDSKDPDDESKTPFGTWLAQMPAAAIVGGVFISHSGWTRHLDEKTLASSYEKAFVEQATHSRTEQDDMFLCGDPSTERKIASLGLINANAWWQMNPDTLDLALANIGASQILFGHDPNAFAASDVRGDMGGFFGGGKSAARLVNLDVGIFQKYADGGILKCDSQDWDAKGTCLRFEKLILPATRDKNHQPEFIELEVKPHNPNLRERAPRDGC